MHYQRVNDSLGSCTSFGVEGRGLWWSRKKRQSILGANGDGIHVFAWGQTFDSVRPFLAHPLYG